MERSAQNRLARRLQRAALILLLVPLGLGYQPARADHAIDIQFRSKSGSVPPRALSFRFRVDGWCGHTAHDSVSVASSGTGTSVENRTKTSCVTPEAWIVYSTDRGITRRVMARFDEETYRYTVRIPMKHVVPGTTIRYWLAARQRWCDASAAVGIFPMCVPPVGVRATPEDCHWAEDQTPTYTLTVVGP